MILQFISRCKKYLTKNMFHKVKEGMFHGFFFCCFFFLLFFFFFFDQRAREVIKYGTSFSGSDAS